MRIGCTSTEKSQYHPTQLLKMELSLDVSMSILVKYRSIQMETAY